VLREGTASEGVRNEFVTRSEGGEINVLMKST